MQATLERWRKDRTAYRIRIAWAVFVAIGSVISLIAWIASLWHDLSVGLVAFTIASTVLLAVFTWIAYVWISLWIMDFARARRDGGNIQHTRFL